MHIAPDFMIRGTCIAQHAIKLTPARVRIYIYIYIYIYARAPGEPLYYSDIHFIITNTRRNYATQ